MNYKEFLLKVREMQNDQAPHKEWTILKNLVDKVKPEGVFREFYGDTTVFKSIGKDIENIQNIQKQIKEGFKESLVQLDPKTFHLTLQGLNTKYTTLFGGVDEINQSVQENKILVEKAFKEISRSLNGKKIKFRYLDLKLTKVGIVIHTFPKTEEDYDLYYQCKNIMQKYGLWLKDDIPHISLFYFKPDPSFKKYKLLKEHIENWNSKIKMEELDFNFEIDQLAYQYLHNMNDFRDIFKIEDFKY